MAGEIAGWGAGVSSERLCPVGETRTLDCVAAWPLPRAFGFVASAGEIPNGPTPLPTHTGKAPEAAPPLVAAGMETVPLFALVSPREALRLVPKLAGESDLDSVAGLWKLTVRSATLVFRATVGADWVKSATRQVKRIPTIEAEPDLPPASFFT